ncbi:MAG: GSCFA domain-containing protein [Rikenellaceae bacterium]
MQLQTKVEKVDFKNKIDYKSTIFMIGSCFSANIGEKLIVRRFNTLYNPLGTLYNPQSVVDTLTILKEKRLITTDDLFFHRELYGSFIANTLLTSSRAAEAVEMINSAIIRGEKQLRESDFIIITLGTSLCYYQKESGKAVANCHKFPAADFERKLIDSDETYELFASLFKQEYFKDKHIIFTVSPVRYIKDGFAVNSVSKAHLLVAVDNLCKKFENVDYYPSYEIFNDELRDYRFYDSDMVHPSKIGVDYVWERFSTEVIDVDSQRYMKEVESVVKALAHRPQNPQSAAHQKFLSTTFQKAQQLEKEIGIVLNYKL